MSLTQLRSRGILDGTISAGDLATGVGGKVLQVVTANYSTEVSINSNTNTDTGLTASITPASTSNKILVLANHGLFVKLVGSAYGAVKLMRSSTDLVDLGNIPFTDLSGTGQIRFPTLSFMYLDSPNTTSSTTYKTQFRAISGTLYLQYQNNPSSITLIEIAG